MEQWKINKMNSHAELKEKRIMEENRERKIGLEVINLLGLKSVKTTELSGKLYYTDGGNKTALGLGRIIEAIINENQLKS